MPAQNSRKPRIEGVEKIVCRACFINSSYAGDMNQSAYVKVSFEQIDNGHGLDSSNPLESFIIEGRLCNPPIEGCESFAWHYEYEDIYSLTSARARRMSDFMQWLDRETEKLNRKLGRPLTFGQYVVRVLSVLGITEGLIDNGRPVDAIIYRAPGELVYPIDERIRQKNEDWHGARFWTSRR